MGKKDICGIALPVSKILESESCLKFIIHSPPTPPPPPIQLNKTHSLESTLCECNKYLFGWSNIIGKGNIIIIILEKVY